MPTSCIGRVYLCLLGLKYAVASFADGILVHVEIVRDEAQMGPAWKPRGPLMGWRTFLPSLGLQVALQAQFRAATIRLVPQHCVRQQLLRMPQYGKVP